MCFIHYKQPRVKGSDTTVSRVANINNIYKHPLLPVLSCIYTDEGALSSAKGKGLNVVVQQKVKTALVI